MLYWRGMIAGDPLISQFSLLHCSDLEHYPGPVSPAWSHQSEFGSVIAAPDTVTLLTRARTLEFWACQSNMNLIIWYNYLMLTGNIRPGIHWLYAVFIHILYVWPHIRAPRSAGTNFINRFQDFQEALVKIVIAWLVQFQGLFIVYAQQEGLS